MDCGLSHNFKHHPSLNTFAAQCPAMPLNLQIVDERSKCGWMHVMLMFFLLLSHNRGSDYID